MLDAMERRFEAMPDAMAVRRYTFEHVIGTIKAGWVPPTSERTASRSRTRSVVAYVVTEVSTKPSYASGERIDFPTPATGLFAAFMSGGTDVSYRRWEIKACPDYPMHCHTST